MFLNILFSLLFAPPAVAGTIQPSCYQAMPAVFVMELSKISGPVEVLEVEYLKRTSTDRRAHEIYFVVAQGSQAIHRAIFTVEVGRCDKPNVHVIAE